MGIAHHPTPNPQRTNFSLQARAVVIYVDTYPIVSTYARALLVENDRTHFAPAELTRPQVPLTHLTARRDLDFNRPIMLLQCAILHHINDETRPSQIMTEYIDALPSGSLVGLTHFWDPEDGGEGPRWPARSRPVFRTRSMGTSRYRTRTEIQAVLDGLDLIEPGRVEPHQWWPDGPMPARGSLVEHLVLGAVGRKPGKPPS